MPTPTVYNLTENSSTPWQPVSLTLPAPGHTYYEPVSVITGNGEFGGGTLQMELSLDGGVSSVPTKRLTSPGVLEMINCDGQLWRLTLSGATEPNIVVQILHAGA